MDAGRRPLMEALDPQHLACVTTSARLLVTLLREQSTFTGKARQLSWGLVAPCYEFLRQLAATTPAFIEPRITRVPSISVPTEH